MKLTVRLIALLMGILMLSGCGPSTIGEKQSFNPNLTVGESQEQTQENTQQKVDTLKLPCDYDSLIASPWNCADQNSRKAAMLLYDSPVFLTQQFQGRTSFGDCFRFRNTVDTDSSGWGDLFRWFCIDSTGDR